MPIPNLIQPHKAYCEEVGDMWRIHNAAGMYFTEHCGVLSKDEAFMLGQLYACSSVEEAEFIYGEYLEEVEKQPN